VSLAGKGSNFPQADFRESLADLQEIKQALRLHNRAEMKGPLRRAVLFQMMLFPITKDSALSMDFDAIEKICLTSFGEACDVYRSG
jgi:hypothetical protein